MKYYLYIYIHLLHINYVLLKNSFKLLFFYFYNSFLLSFTVIYY